jgi:ABC-2 type transport system ATP-binding protein
MTTAPASTGIVARDVCKSFGDHLVLDKVSLAAEEGTILALLGPNGAGKTTMVHILSTLIPADSGSMRIAGHDVVTDPNGVRAVIGVTGQFSAVDNLLTGAENLQMIADLRHLGREAGRRRVDELLEQFDLTDAAHKLLSTYSGGMRRRLDLAMTLVGKPGVIFLDEPTTGLDPRSRRTMWQIIRELASAGVTILLTTQYLDEADQLADRIAVLDQGRIVAEEPPPS